MTLLFFLNSILLGVGLAMDAFSVSLANGLREPHMGGGRMAAMAGVYAGFQFAMPVIGWYCVHSFVEKFRVAEPFIPWIALALLCYIGGKMIWEGVSEHRSKPDSGVDGARDEAISIESSNHDASVSETGAQLTAFTLVLQGIATSIDALSVGFTISEYTAIMALVCGLLIAAVTFVICMAGLSLGKRFGVHLGGKASILGGLILIGIGLEIVITHYIG